MPRGELRHGRHSRRRSRRGEGRRRTREEGALIPELAGAHLSDVGRIFRLRVKLRPSRVALRRTAVTLAEAVRYGLRRQRHGTGPPRRTCQTSASVRGRGVLPSMSVKPYSIARLAATNTFPVWR